MTFSALKGSMLVILSALFFGLAPVLIKLAYQTDISPFALSAYSYILACLIFTGYLLAAHSPFKIPFPVLLKVFLMGVFLRGGMSIGFFMGYQYISASLGELIFYIYPTLTLIIAHFYLHEALSVQKILAVLISFGGCFFILQTHVAAAKWLGVALLSLTAVCNALNISFNTVFLKTVSPILLSYYSGIGCCLTLTLAGFFTRALPQAISPGNIAIAAGIAVSIVIGTVVFLFGIRMIGAGKSALLCTFEPVATILLSAVLLRERLLPMQALGAAMIIGAAVIAIMPGKRKEIKGAPAGQPITAPATVHGGCGESNSE